MNRLPVIVRQHIAGFRILLVFTVICGFVYPLVMLGVSQVAFHNQANGSLVSYNGHVVGSSLLCQEFVDAKGNPLPQYFQPRPSYAIPSPAPKGDYGCDPTYSSASNLGPNPTLVQAITQRQKQISHLFFFFFFFFPPPNPPPSAATPTPTPKGDYGCDPTFSSAIQPGAHEPSSGSGDQAAAAADRGVRPRPGLADPGGRGDRVRVRA